MSEQMEKVLGGVLVGALVLSAFVKPSESDFEHKVAASFQQAQSRTLNDER